MFEFAKGWVLRFLRVPAEPRPPAGGRVVRVFRAAPAYYRYRLALWALGQVGALMGLVASLLWITFLLREVVSHPTLVFLLQAGEAVAWAAFVVQLVFSLAVLRLDYEMRWYILSDRSLRIREGVVSVREKTITFANIQNISIRQNPLQRLLRLSDVRVTTAGGGAGAQGTHGQVGESMHEAYFRGVDNAEEIRDVIAQRVRLHRDAGLGDPDEPAPLAEPSDADVLAAARELRDEVRGLREALVPSSPAS
ncbi:MAG TPA: PH domain-containing protein [Longimicrobium sp.]|nr:PH domain-containing protein [Longimicrobium sp.]